MSFLLKKRVGKKIALIKKTLAKFPACSMAFQDNEQDQVDPVIESIQISYPELIILPVVWSFVDGDYTMFVSFGHNPASAWDDACRMTRAIVESKVEDDIKEGHLKTLNLIKGDIEKEYGIVLPEFSTKGPITAPYAGKV